MKAPRFAANNRAQKKALAYDGHNKKAGTGTADKAYRWRRIRRRVAKWMKESIL